MKVSILIINYPPSIGGAQLHFQHVAEGLARHGHEVEILTTTAMRAPAGTNPGRIDVRDEVLGGVRVRRFPVPVATHTALRSLRKARNRVGARPSGTPSPLAMGPLGVRLADAVRRAGRTRDVVIGVANPFATIPMVGWATRHGRAAGIATPLLHLPGTEPRPVVMDALRRMDGCSVSTTFERDWLVDHGVASSVIALLPPGCEPDRYPELDAPTARARLGLPEAPTVGCLGRITPLKGVDTMLEAMPSIWERHPDARILIAGSRTGWGGFEELVARIEARRPGCTTVVNEFDEDRKSLLYAACDVIGFPSHEESFGMVTIEAWSARRPVVASDLDAIATIVRPGIDGELAPVGDAAAFAAAIGDLLADPDRARRMGLAGRARAEGEFSWDGIVDGWDRFVHETVERHHRRSGSTVDAPGTAARTVGT